MRNIQDYDSIGLWDDRMTIFYILLFSSAGIGLPPFALIAIVFIIVSPFLSANLRLSFVINKELRQKMHLLTYTWPRAKHYNTQNDSASLLVLRR